jgi:hypothetical protein
MSDTPFTLAEIDDDIAADLRAIGITVATPEELEQSQRDALAGILLRRMQQLDEEYESLNGAFKTELELLQHSFSRRLGPLSTRRAELEAQVKVLAQIALGAGGFGDKKKSRDVGYGTYGARTIPAKFEIADDTMCLRWAEQHDPSVVRVTLQMSLAVMQILFDNEPLPPDITEKKREVLVSQVKANYGSGEEPPPGCITFAKHEEYFARPEPLR